MDVNLDSVTGIPYTNTFLNFGTNTTVLVILVFVILAVTLLFSSLGGSNPAPADNGVADAGTGSSKSTSALEIMLWGIFIVLILLNGMSYFFNINITASLKNLFGANPEIDVLVDPDTIAGDAEGKPSGSAQSQSGDGDPYAPIPEITAAKQVFHIPGNKYNYRDAKALCNAYGAELADYTEVEKAYRNGADWCSYGWSKDQMALYPTQYDKWQYLQKVKGHEHDCGRPGVNGGFIDNKNVRFGINCFGFKPEITEREEELMNESSIYPKTKKEVEFDKRVDFWQDKLSEILVAPFNHNNWSII